MAIADSVHAQSTAASGSAKPVARARSGKPPSRLRAPRCHPGIYWLPMPLLLASHAALEIALRNTNDVTGIDRDRGRHRHFFEGTRPAALNERRGLARSI